MVNLTSERFRSKAYISVEGDHVRELSSARGKIQFEPLRCRHALVPRCRWRQHNRIRLFRLDDSICTFGHLDQRLHVARPELRIVWFIPQFPCPNASSRVTDNGSDEGVPIV